MSSTPAESIAAEARRESPLWASALREVPDWEPVFSTLAPSRYELGLETVYEAYLVHYGRPRLFEPDGETERILLGDYLYAHGLVRVAATGEVSAVAELAELISLCARLRAEGEEGDGEAWLATAVSLGGDADEEAAERALTAHRQRVS